MIGKANFGKDAGRLLRYLYGPGADSEHVDPHLVAAWDGDHAALEPMPTATGRYDLRRLAGLLMQPVAAAPSRPTLPVWHCSVRAAPTDRRLTDSEWSEVAREVVHVTTFAVRGDEAACRWVAVRHSDNHIHIVVTTVRQDGHRQWSFNAFFRVGEVCRAAEERLGLERTAPPDRTAPRPVSRAELEKAKRAGRSEPARVTLQREVRIAAAGAETPDAFLSRLTDAGLLVRVRRNDRNQISIEGYAVALPGDRRGDSEPVWFGGSKLAADLSWPKLAHRWSQVDQPGRPASAGATRLAPGERAAAWRAVRVATVRATAALNGMLSQSGEPASDVAAAAADLLSATARAVEGRRSGPLSAAADAYDRAAREPYGYAAPRTSAGAGLRRAARVLARTGRANRHDTDVLLVLITNLTDLVDAVARLRHRQERAAQAAAAHRTVRLLTSSISASADDGRAGETAIHITHSHASVHRSTMPTASPPSSRRKVTS